MRKDECCRSSVKVEVEGDAAGSKKSERGRIPLSVTRICTDRVGAFSASLNECLLK